MNARKIELFYHPVFKGSKEPTQEEVQRKVTTYLTHHPEFKPQKEETWSCFKLSPGLTHASVECYLCVTQTTKGTRRFGGYNPLLQY